MSKGTKGLLAVVGILVMLFAVGFIFRMTTSNREKTLRNQAAAQQKVCQTSFDTAWKTIQQKCQIKDSYKDSFKEIFSGIMAERYGNNRGGALMSWVQESNPNFDASIFKDVMTTIEAQRTSFKFAQDKLIDIKNQHDNLRMNEPWSWFVGGRPELEITIVTSSKTNKAFETGVEDDIDLSGK